MVLIVNSSFRLKSIWFSPFALEDSAVPVIFLPYQMILFEESITL